MSECKLCGGAIACKLAGKSASTCAAKTATCGNRTQQGAHQSSKTNWQSTSASEQQSFSIVDGHTVSSPEIQKAWVAEGTTNLTVSFGFGVPTIDGVPLAAGSLVMGGMSMHWTQGADHLPAVLGVSTFSMGWLGSLNGFRDASPGATVSDRLLFTVTSISPVPEPDASVLLLLGVAGLVLLRRSQCV